MSFYAYCQRCNTEFFYPVVDCPHCGIPTKPQEVQGQEYDPVNSPAHYKDRVPGIEAIEVTENFNFNVGNALKYLWRHGMKGDPVQDLEKAVWYIQREIKRLKGENKK